MWRWLRAHRGVCMLAMGMLLGFGLMHAYTSITVVHGRSMEPTYHSGDLVLSLRTGGYVVGDIITYHPRGLPCGRCNVVHRIIGGEAGRGWITQGDNNATLDPWQPVAADIRGRAILHVRMPPLLQLLYLPQLWLCLLSLAASVYLVRLALTDTLTRTMGTDLERYAAS